jgi:pimeloyl-ACP methyl ester carboxylesterase
MSASGILRWAGRSFLGLLGLVALAGLIGGVASHIATSRGFARYPAPGRLVKVGDHKLHLNCTGRGPATVVFESALGGWSIDWSLVQDQLPPSVRACSYDRAGYGWSDPSHRRYRPDEVARELHELLAAADVSGPYVLVGHSAGGVYVRQFAHLYPADTAGLVFVDSSHEEMVRRYPPDSEFVRRTRMIGFLRIVRFTTITGVARLFRMPVASLPDLRGEQRRIAQAIGYRYANNDAFYNESAAFIAASKDPQFTPPSLPNVPLTVLTSKQNLDDQLGDVWRVLQTELVDLIPESRQTTVDSGHFIQVEKPDAVIAAILDVNDRARGINGGSKVPEN